MGHAQPPQPTGRKVSDMISEGTVAGRRSNAKDAPTAAIRATWIELRIRPKPQFREVRLSAYRSVVWAPPRFRLLRGEVTEHSIFGVRCALTLLRETKSFVTSGARAAF